MIPYLVEYINETRVTLPINLFQFNINRRLHLCYFAAKEIWTTIKLIQHFPFFIRYNGRQLMHIANKQYLCTPKRFVKSSSKMAHDGINCIQSITTNHTYFIYYQQFNASNKFPLLTIQFDST